MSKFIFLSLFWFSTKSATMLDTLPVKKCECDTLKIKSIILNKKFNSVPSLDTVLFLQQNFDTLPSNMANQLWFRDIENAIPTQFTSFWSSGSKFRRTTAYDTIEKFASRENAFIEHYYQRKDIELAIKLGPNLLDLWADHYFVFRKIENCYLVTHSYFRHARFTYKSYSIINATQLKALREILENAKGEDFVGQTANGYAGYFVDNRSKRNLFIDFNRKSSLGPNSNQYSAELQEFFDFLDNKIAWHVTYLLK